MTCRDMFRLWINLQTFIYLTIYPSTRRKETNVTAIFKSIEKRKRTSLHRWSHTYTYLCISETEQFSSFFLSIEIKCVISLMRWSSLVRTLITVFDHKLRIEKERHWLTNRENRAFNWGRTRSTWYKQDCQRVDAPVEICRRPLRTSDVPELLRWWRWAIVALRLRHSDRSNTTRGCLCKILELD